MNAFMLDGIYKVELICWDSNFVSSFILILRFLKSLNIGVSSKEFHMGTSRMILIILLGGM